MLPVLRLDIFLSAHVDSLYEAVRPISSLLSPVLKECGFSGFSAVACMFMCRQEELNAEGAS